MNKKIAQETTAITMLEIIKEIALITAKKILILLEIIVEVILTVILTVIEAGVNKLLSKKHRNNGVFICVDEIPYNQPLISR